MDKLQELEKLKDNKLLKEMEKEMILDGLIKKGDFYRLELNDKEFKINGKKQSEKQLKKYLKLLDKQRKQRLKLKSKLSHSKPTWSDVDLLVMSKK